jgi:hypothetical protein
MEIEVPAMSEVRDQEIGVGKVAIRDCEDSARGARDAGLGKFAFDREFCATRAFSCDLKAKQGSQPKDKKRAKEKLTSIRYLDRLVTRS